MENQLPLVSTRRETPASNHPARVASAETKPAPGPHLLSSLLCTSAPCCTSLSSTSTGEAEGGTSSSAPPFAFFSSSSVFLLTK